MGMELTQAMFQGYFCVIPENMCVPKAMFLSEEEALKYADGMAVKKYPASSSVIEFLCPLGALDARRKHQPKTHYDRRGIQR